MELLLLCFRLQHASMIKQIMHIILCCVTIMTEQWRQVGSRVPVLRGKFATQRRVMQVSEIHVVGQAQKRIGKLNGGVLELEQRHLIPPPSMSVSLEEDDSCSSNTSSNESSTSDQVREVDEDGAFH